ncbi:hypothetical protein [Guptibacillus hwajinpoensis]|uniref:Uncharacterized protein n=2 Tax=Guptibacillus hwajinpoensis TaxID=208199 RepID=A0A0J6D1N5_9BACL|nr:hypothetical protein [Alkalihalobacillus macyae]KMM39193.1 hypothetical protein AB986_08195 [Alkalihalobacillus macyae]
MTIHTFHHGNDRSLFQFMNCVNQWITITFKNGQKFQVYPTSIGFTSVSGYVPHTVYNALTCRGSEIKSIAQAQGCLNQWVQVTLKNNITLSFYLTSYDEQYVGGNLQTNELLKYSDLIADVTC